MSKPGPFGTQRRSQATAATVRAACGDQALLAAVECRCRSNCNSFLAPTKHQMDRRELGDENTKAGHGSDATSAIRQLTP